MATLYAGCIPQLKLSSASSSGSLGFIVCLQCCRMVDTNKRKKFEGQNTVVCKILRDILFLVDKWQFSS